MNILFVGIRGNEQEITSAPKKISNALYNRMSKTHDNVYFFGLPWEGDKPVEDDDHVMVGELTKLGGFIKEKKIDVVYFSRYYTKIALYLLLIKPIYRFKLIYTVHGIIKKEKVINNTFKYYSVLIEERLLKACDRIITVSDGLKEELLKFYPNLYKSRVEVIFNGVSVNPVEEYVDIRKLYSIEKNRKILFTTGTRKIKNNEILINSILENEKLKASTFLIIAGPLDTEYGIMLEDKYSNEANIKFTGELRVDLINNIYSQMDLYIQISSFETFGMAIVEALLHKKNVLLSERLPIASYFTEQEVSLWNPADDLWVAIAESLQTRGEVNESGYEKAAEIFNWDTITEKYYKTFTGVL